jgi:hypothetical protein
MKHLRKVSVVTEGGKLVGVHIPPESPSDPRAPLAALVAGPKQKLRQIEIEVPLTLNSGKEVDAFHASIRKAISRSQGRGAATSRGRGKRPAARARRASSRSAPRTRG